MKEMMDIFSVLFQNDVTRYARFLIKVSNTKTQNSNINDKENVRNWKIDQYNEFRSLIKVVRIKKIPYLQILACDVLARHAEN